MRRRLRRPAGAGELRPDGFSAVHLRREFARQSMSVGGEVPARRCCGTRAADLQLSPVCAA
ncbi:hypothetical protein ACIBP6_28295 [Nonomuraea terrae]|uniref:hypothetical protein n=1 Tax=Nonomuraea terrae TaxID=2530383 RepID=UPI0037A23B3F